MTSDQNNPVAEQGKSKGISGREVRLVIILVLMIATAVTFGSIATHDFVTWDDGLHVYKNPWFHPPTWGNIAHFWRAPYEMLYVPMAYTLFGVLAMLAVLTKPDATVTDTGAMFDPHIFHTASLALHVVNVLLVFAILRLLVKRDIPAAIGALLFAVHPLQVESVAWISELRGLLCATFSLGAMAVYLSISKPAKALTGPAYVVLAVLIVLAMLSKPWAAVVPMLIFAIGYGLLNRPWKLAALDTAPLFAVAIPIILLTSHQQTVAHYNPPSWPQRVLVAGDALSFYLAKLVAPVNMAIDYGRHPGAVLHHWWGLVTWLAVAAVAVAVWLLRKRAQYLPGAFALFVISLGPVLGFIPFVYQAFSTVADRYAYMALLGPAIAIAFAIARSVRPPRAYAAVGACAVLAGIAYTQCQHWQDSETLYKYSLSVAPLSAAIQNNYGELIIDRDPAAAEQHFRAAIAANPGFGNEHTNLGTLLFRRGFQQEGVAECQEAVRLEPDKAFLRFDLANCLSDLGHNAEAIVEYETALKVDPSYVAAANNLGATYMATHQYDLAADAFAKAASLRPGNANFRLNQATALEKAGRIADARIAYQAALALDPNATAASEALARLGR